MFPGLDRENDSLQCEDQFQKNRPLRVGFGLIGKVYGKAKMMKKKLSWKVPALFLIAIGAIVGSCAVLGVAPSEMSGPRLFNFPGDWNNIPAKTVTLFYPGQASWQFLTSDAHPGAKAIDAGCATCHTGQEKALGAKLVQAGPRENDPIAGKIPSIDLTVRAAYDAEFIYLQFRWASKVPHAMHTLWRYDGKQWVARSEERRVGKEW